MDLVDEIGENSEKCPGIFENEENKSLDRLKNFDPI
jgi:hypothetical protein